MAEKTVIIAHRRIGQDYWEGYAERPESEVENWVDYFGNLGQIARKFASITDYRADCCKLLDEWDSKRKEKVGNGGDTL